MKNLVLVCGGPGRESEVSLSSAKNIREILEANKIPFDFIVINKDGTWSHQNATLSEDEGVMLLRDKNALVFQVIHGTYGEDGIFVSLLEKNNISYVGSSSEAMKVTIDKYKTEQTLQKNNILTTNSVVIDSLSMIDELQNKDIVFPVIVKPKGEGSSVALSKVANIEDLKKILKETLPVYGTMLVQHFVSGREFTCGVAEIGGKIVALTPTEVILTKGELFDYEAKYSVGGSKEVTPAEVDEVTTRKIQDLALQVHNVCGCKDISRTDMIMDADGNLVVLEINTVPGMTKTSFIPAQLSVSGYSLVDFIQGMLQKYT